MTVALFIPCFIDQLFPGVGIAALQVLERLGLEVEVPQDVACCGQPPANAGYERLGTGALRTFVAAFADYDRIVDTCLALARDASARRRIADAGFEIVSARRQEELLREALAPP